MSLLDAAVLSSALLLAALVLSGRADQRRLRRGVAIVAAACALQWLVEGLYLHFAPLYVLLLALAVRALARRPSPATLRASRAGIGALALLALLPWMLFLPVPELPAPSGPHAVGTEVFRWVDDSRPETATDAPEDRRNVVVQAWYPAAAGASGQRPIYIDGLGRMPSFVSVLPSLIMARYDRVDTHAVVAAPLAAAQPSWPVVLFSPGYGAPRAFYTGLLVDLASRGFVVLAVDHPYETAVTELADGRVATANDRFLAADPEGLEYMSRQMAVRAADLRFVLDRIAQPGALGARLSGRLDLGRVAAIGHSFGGPPAALAMDEDVRIAAAANIDGTLYGVLPDRSLRRPLLLLESDHEETGHSQRYLDGNQRLIRNLHAAGYRFEIEEANHYSFTDAPLYFSPPARLAMAVGAGGSRGPEHTQRATNDILVAFLAAPLGLSPAQVEAAAAHHDKIHGGRVSSPAAR